jgi:dolichol-phosphate mannosyltransferase
VRVSVVISAFDERESVEVLIPRLVRTLGGIERLDFELIFVVEGLDGTREAVERLVAEVGAARVLWNARPGGLGNAFRLGFSSVSADSDFVLTMDADLNHQPEEIPRFIEAIERTKADIVIGSRFLAESLSDRIPMWKRLLSGLMNRVIGILFGVEVRDKTSGYRLYRASCLKLLTSYRSEDFAFLPEILIKAERLGLQTVEIPIHFIYRVHGRSKMAFGRTIRSYLALLGRLGD